MYRQGQVAELHEEVPPEGGGLGAELAGVLGGRGGGAGGGGLEGGGEEVLVAVEVEELAGEDIGVEEGGRCQCGDGVRVGGVDWRVAYRKT